MHYGTWQGAGSLHNFAYGKARPKWMGRRAWRFALGLPRVRVPFADHRLGNRDHARRNLHRRRRATMSTLRDAGAKVRWFGGNSGDNRATGIKPASMARTPHLRDSIVTIGDSVLQNLGLNLYCLDCGHRASWSPSELANAEPPRRLVWDFKRRRKCSKCGTGGSTDRVYLTCYVVGTEFSIRPSNPTPPQLWPS